MLSDDVPAASLNPVRKHTFTPDSTRAMGEETSRFQLSGAVMCNAICGMLCGGGAQVACFHVNQDRVTKAKAEAIDATPEASFVSTNDVLVSSFGLSVGARVLLMPINFRNRLPEYNDDDAGNYEGSLAFGAEEYRRPGLIRRTIQSAPPTFIRGGEGMTVEPFPSGLGAARCRLAMVTSWIFPCFEELNLPGCQQIIHLPHSNPKLIPFDIALPFRPRAGETAVAFFVRSCGLDVLQAECPLGSKIVSPELSGFPQ